jgi:DnaJ-class molecular chaperone
MAHMTKTEPCDRCEGYGVVIAGAVIGGMAMTKTCPKCKGTKFIDVEKATGHFATPEMAK